MAAMRILLVNDSALEDGWGAETYLRRLADGLQAAGDVVEILAGAVTHHGAGKVLDVWDPAARRLVARHAGEFGADVVHHHNVLRELSASVLGVPAGVPTVLTVHDLRLTGARDHAAGALRALPSMAKSQLDRRVARRTVDAALAVSEPIASALRSAGFRGVSVVPVPVDPPVTPPVDLRACGDIVYAGRLAPDKGVDVLIDAFAGLAGTHPDTTLLVAGSGEEDAALRARAARLGDRVRFLGRLPAAELSALLGGARVVAVPSVPSRRPEGSPLAVVEAAMHGRPVVASDDPGIAALIAGLGCGVTAPAGDVGALTAALSVVLSDDDVAVRYGAAGAQAASSRHSVTAVTAAVREVYAGLVGPPSGSTAA
jgi:glycosyltransferase involved in cell wall biosynthesis